MSNLIAQLSLDLCLNKPLSGVTMNNMNGKWALITGASSGLGMDFARELAATGHHLVLVARRVEPMQALADELAVSHGIKTRVIGMDLAQSGVGDRKSTRLNSSHQ